MPDGTPSLRSKKGDIACRAATDAQHSPRHPATDHCGLMTELRIGEQVTLNGRAFEIMGITAMSVKPKRVFLRDVETGEQVDVLADELRTESET